MESAQNPSSPSVRCHFIQRTNHSKLAKVTLSLFIRCKIDFPNKFRNDILHRSIKKV